MLHGIEAEVYPEVVGPASRWSSNDRRDAGPTGHKQAFSPLRLVPQRDFVPLVRRRGWLGHALAGRHVGRFRNPPLVVRLLDPSIHRLPQSLQRRLMLWLAGQVVDLEWVALEVVQLL